MKKIILSMLVLALITFTTQAQTRRVVPSKTETSEANGAGNHQNADHKRARHEMIKSLNLSKSQQQQMKSLNTDFKSKMSDLKSQNLSADELKTKKKELKDERKQKLETLLTPEQKTKMEQFKKDAHKNKDRKGSEGIKKMQTSLNLSDTQVETLKANKESYSQKEEAIKSNNSLSAGQKKEQLKALRTESKNSFKSVLTPEQVQKLEAMRNKKPVKTT